jgi:hypothetical protein
MAILHEVFGGLETEESMVFRNRCLSWIQGDVGKTVDDEHPLASGGDPVKMARKSVIEWILVYEEDALEVAVVAIQALFVENGATTGGEYPSAPVGNLSEMAKKVVLEVMVVTGIMQGLPEENGIQIVH